MSTQVRTTVPDGGTVTPEERARRREDYVRERLPAARRRSGGAVMMVLVGIITAFFFPTTGGDYLLSYGAAATWIGLGVGFVLITALTLVTTSAAAREGLNSDLLTRGCGYGYAGSAVTALLYAATFVIYAALEGQILATSIEQVWGLPIGVWYVVVGLVFIPLTWYGMTQLSVTMWVSLPIYLVLIAVAIATALNRHGGFPGHLFDAVPPHAITGAAGVAGVLGGVAGTIGLNPLEFSDYARFAGPESPRRRALLTVVLPYALMFFVAFPLGIFFTLITGQTNPGIYFVGLLGLGFGVVFAWVTQVRINLTNVYSGSVALSNVFTRALHWSPSRIVSVAVIAAGSVGLMFANILTHLLSFLEWDGIFLLSWVGTVVCDLLIVRRLMGLVRGRIECDRERLWLINPVGPIALAVAVGTGSALHYAVSNAYVKDLAGFIAFGVAVVVHALMAQVTRGRYYLRS
ncbi:MAG TPA: hypothetical protein VGL69_12580 [Solirubrobacteraceae bacterium]|jgi:purine-cytosine permease-like protein